MSRYLTNSKLLLLVVFIFQLSLVNGQNGPGGVGNTSNLPLWLRSTDLNIGNGAEVVTWPDKSGNGHDFTGLAGGSLRPTFRTDALNGAAGILFSGDRSRLEDADGEAYINGLGAFTIITLIQSDELSTVDVGIFDTQNANGTDDVLTWRYDNAGLNGGGDNVIKWGLGPNNTAQLESADNTHTVNPQLLIGTWHSGDIMRLYLDGALNIPTANSAAWTGTISGADRAVLGVGPKDNNNNTGWDGYIFEFALLNFDVNAVERILIENYLAAKYKLTVVNDFYVFENTHGQDLVGIGQSGTDTHTSSFSDNIFGISSPSALADGDWLLTGHDGGDASAWSTNERINGDVNLERIAREWRLDVTNDPGTVTLIINPTDLPAFNSDFGFYTLWVDNDGDFTSGATQYPLTQNGANFEATGVTVTDGAFVTIAAYRPQINFAKTAFSGLETTTPAVFNVNIAYPVNAAISVDFTVSGTYETLPAAGTFTIAAGSTTASLSHPIATDAVFENDETIILSLTGASQSAGVIGSANVSTYTVYDDGASATNRIQFDAPFSYGFKKTITISEAMVSGSSNFANFPVMIRINGAALTEMETNGIRGDAFDIRFTLPNSLVWLDHQIERYSAGVEYIAWVKIPTLRATTNTQIEMFYGNATAATNPSLNTVFTSNYEAVYHLENTTDGSDNGNNGTLVGNATDIIAGRVGNGLDLGGTEDYLNIPSSTSLVLDEEDGITLSGWYKGGDSQGDIISKMNGANGNKGYALRIFGGELSFLLIDYFPNGSDKIIRVSSSSSAVVRDGFWHYLVATYDGSTNATGVTIYIDGVATSTDAGQLEDRLAPGDDVNGQVPLMLGKRPNITNQGLSGLIDEIRVVRSQLSSDWIKTEYNNQSDNGTLITSAASVATSGFPIAESTDNLSLSIALSSVDANDVSVNYAITSSTATNGVDYMLASGTATVTAGNLRTSIFIELTDDAVDELDETFTVSLSNVTSISDVSLGTNNEIEITLLDNDNGPTLAVSDTLISVNEGSSINSLTFELSAASGQAVTVDYTVTALSATQNADFVFNSGTLTIPADSTSASLTFNVIDDDIVEVAETFAIKLSNAINATINSAYDSITVTVNDNDNFGIDGPGGVGDADGTGTLVMWMIADSAQASGGAVTSWENEVGISELNLAPSGIAPTLVTNAKNGHAEISFANVNDALSTTQTLSASYFPYNEASVFVVTRHDNLTQRANTYGTSRVPNGSADVNRFSAHNPWNGTTYFDIGSWNNNGRSQFTYDANWNGQYTLFSYVAGETEGRTVRGNSTQKDFDTGTSSFINHRDYYFNLGHTQTNPFQGDILEFILYTSPLNKAQVIITENYLAAKYDLPLDQNDYFAFNTSHGFELVGIGREDVNNFHLAAKSSLLTLSNASDLDNGEYVMVGHDNASTSAWNTTDIPADLNNIQRVTREWRVDPTGTPGTISIAIDGTKLPALPANYTDYVLLTDADGLFNSGAKVYPMTLISGEYVANDVIIEQGTYFTIGTHRRTIAFVGNAKQAYENINNTISLSLSLASGSDISIPYTITGTATNGQDYTLAASGSFIIRAGNTLRNIDLGILDENIEETDETIIITLGTIPAGNVVGGTGVFTYTINDDDIIRSLNIDHFKYSKAVTINGGQVTGTHTDFPVMVSFTDVDLRSTANSGFVENTNGYDIAFYDSLNSAWLDHQLEYYNAATGEVVIWVKIPSLVNGVDVELDMFYGNPGIEFDQSSKSTWKTAYQAIWHMGGDDFDNAAGSGSNGVDQGTSEVAGIIGRAASFDGVSNVKVSDVSNLSFGIGDSYTISAWYKGTDRNNTVVGLVDDNNGGQGYDISINNQRKLVGTRKGDTGPNADIVGSAGANVDNNLWNHLVITFDGTNGIAYQNGANVMTGGTPETGVITGILSPNISFTIGSRSSGAAISNAITGAIDEVRVLNEALSPDWIATEYANQSNPGSFLTINTTQVTNESLTLAEAANEVTVTIRVDPVDNSQATTFTFGDVGTGTATLAEDFTLSPSTISIPAGDRLGTFTFNVTNDLINEQDETIILNINTPSSNTKLGTVSQQTYTIIDDDDLPVIGFIDTVSVANEGASVVVLSLQLNVASGNDVSVNYSVTGGTATSGSDFIALTGTATIAAGNLTGTISFQPIDDALIEAPETVQLSISSPTNATIAIDNDVQTITIADNDNLGFEGPGGVGDVANVNGEKLLKIWLIADSVTSTGGNVTRWNNLVKNVSVDYDMVPVGTAPFVISDAVNGHKEISFNNVNDALVSEGTLSAASFPGNEMSMFIVTQADNLSQNSYAYATDNSPTGAVDNNSVSAAIPNSSGSIDFDMATDGYTATYQTSWAGKHSIFTHIVSTDTFLVYRNNTSLVNRNDNNTNFTGHTAYNFYLGKSGATGNFQGDIAEVILFSRDVNAAQSNIINNYLAAKYNLTIANDLYNFEVSHGEEVAGIGRVNSTNQHVAARAGIVTISNADDLDDGEYVLFGHDNKSISSWVNAEVPAAGILRTAREWRFSNTGSPGTISIAINSNLLPPLPNGNEDYVILKDADGNFASGATVINTVFVDGQYKASGLSISSGDYVTFGIASRTVSFVNPQQSGSEAVPANAQVSLSLASSTNITLDYQITGGTATGNNTDYSLAATGQITFIAGQTTTNLALGIINDAILESDETIQITLSNPPTGVSLVNSVYTYTINDDDKARNVQFDVNASSGDESTSAVSFQVVLNSVDPANDTQVDYTISGGTAEASPAPDYTFTSGTLTIPSNQTTSTINLTVLDDVLSETTETIIISLSNPVNANLGTNVSHTYSIIDNDQVVTVQFQDVSMSIDEGGSIAEIIVELSETSGQAVKINYTVNPITATGSGVDYSLANGILTIPAGSQLGKINLALTDDGIEESAETLTLTLSNPVGATLGSNTVHTVTIVDNDALFGFYGPGGVGDAESNFLWLDATAINGKGIANLMDGSSVNTWYDRSGNGYNFAAIGSAPTFDVDALNLKNTVIISSTSQGLQAPVGFTNALSNYTFLSVMRQSSGDYFVETNTTATGDFRLSQGANGLYSLNGSNYLPSQSTGSDVTTWIFNSQNSPNRARVFRNGNALLSNNNFQVMPIANNFAIGSRNSTQTQGTGDFSGNVSEFIIYNNVINDAHRIIVENYLANKYNLPIANDYYSFEGTYGYDIIGIGKINNVQHLQSMSDSLLMISGASSLDNGDFIFAGHDNGNDLTWTVNEAPNNGANIRRLAREWRVDIAGSPGTMIIKIDTTKLPKPPVGYDQYVVYADEDGDFRSGASAYQVRYSPISGFHVSGAVSFNAGTYFTIGVGQPVVQFSLAASSGSESVTNPSIEVALNFTLGASATVNYAATGGSATGGNVDYLLASGTLTIALGQSKASIKLGIINDILQESDETVQITLTTPSNNVSLGARTVHTYTINDNDNPENRTVQFQSAGPGTGDEASSSVTPVTITLNVPDNDVLTTVDLIVLSSGADPATLTDDFILSTTTVSFPADNTTVANTFNIMVVDDAIFEGTERVTIRLSNPVNASLGAATEYTLDITDNDSQPNASFVEGSSFVSESTGTAAIKVELNTPSVKNSTINYTVSATATSGADYTLSDGSILIPAGSTSENIQVIIINDLISEAAENITITLASGTNATVGGITAHVLTILDNDQTGGTGPAGVGDASVNSLWLRGDNFTSGTWTDISGNNNNFTGAGPIDGTNGINSRPTVAFSGAQVMSISSDLSSQASDYDIFLVASTDVTSDQIIFNNASGITLGLENASGAFQDADAAWKGDEIAPGAGVPVIVQYNLESGSGLSSIYIDGTAITPSVAFDYTTSSMAGTSSIGAVSGGFDGEIGELLIYNSILNNAQRIIVNNYLSTRYGIAIPNDYYAFDDGTASNEYYFDLIGIGRVDADNIHVSATSENFLTISNPNDLGDNEFLLLANNGGSMASWSTSGAPANGSTYLTSRRWKVDKNGDVGLISFQIDTTVLPTPPSASLTWALVLSADSDFSTIDTTYPLTSFGNDLVGIDGLNLPDGVYFSIALVQYQSTGASNDFSDPAAWSTGVVPVAGTAVKIVDGHSLVLTQDVVIGSLTLEGTGSLDLAGFTLELSTDCITLLGSGSVNVSTAGSTIGYANPNVTEQCVTGMTYNNLYTDGPAGSTKYLLGNITVQGDLNLQSGGGAGAVFDVRALGTSVDYDMIMQGDWTSDITFLARTGDVTFNGTAPQFLNTAGGENFNNLIINKIGTSSKADSTLSLGSNVTTSGILTLNSGFIDINSSDVVVDATSSISGGSKQSYMITDDVGVLRHAIPALSTAYTFPIGDLSNYSPFTFTLNTGTLNNSNVTINLRAAKHTNIIEGDYIVRYWTLENENIVGPFDYNVSYVYSNGDIVGNENSLLVRKFSASGNYIGGAVNVAANTLSSTGFSSFSDFTAESKPVPLPVSLYSFEGRPTEDGVMLEWVVLSEINNSYFEVMRSADGSNFDKVGRINGAGDSNEKKTYKLLDREASFGSNYYFLKQVDYDGSENLIATIHVDYDKKIEMKVTIYPNPSKSENLNLRISTGDIATPIILEIVNLSGQVFYRDVLSGSSNIDKRVDPMMEMMEGVYILIVKQGDVVSKQKIVIK